MSRGPPLLVTHTGRRDIVRPRPAGRQAGLIAGRHRGPGARRRGRRPRRHRRPRRAGRTRRPPTAPRSCWCSAATARSCARPSWPARRGPRCSASTSAGSASWPRPSRRRSTGHASGTSWRATYTVEERLTLDVDVLDVDGERGRRSTGRSTRCRVEKAERERMLEVPLDIDGRPLTSFGCDGVVCATPDRLDRVRVLRRRAGGLAGGRGAAAGADQRARAVRPAAGDRAGLDRRDHRRPTAGARRRSLGCDGRRIVAVPAGARVEVRRGALPVRIARLHPRPFTDRLVASSACRWTGWRGDRSRPADGAAVDGVVRSVLCWTSCASAASASSTTSPSSSARGLTVVTGETGAGKTMVVTGLDLLFGGRADPARVRAGPAGRWSRAGCGCRPTRRCWQRAARRRRRARRGRRAAAVPHGRGRGPVPGVPRRPRGAGRRCSASWPSGVLAVHGQSDQLRLLRPAEQRAALDRFAGAPIAELLDRHRAAYAALAAAGRRPGRPHGAGPRAGPGGRPAAARAGRDRRGRRRSRARTTTLAAEARAAGARRRAAARPRGPRTTRWPATRPTRRPATRTPPRCSARPAARWRTQSAADPELAALGEAARRGGLPGRRRRRRAGRRTPSGSTPTRPGWPRCEDRRAALHGADPQVRRRRRRGARLGRATPTQRLASWTSPTTRWPRWPRERDAAGGRGGRAGRRAVRGAGARPRSASRPRSPRSWPGWRCRRRGRRSRCAAGRPAAGAPAVELDGRRVAVGPDGVDEVELLLRAAPGRAAAADASAAPPAASCPG